MKKNIDLLIFYVTYKCNSRCKTCFYWKDIHAAKKELSLKEINKISDTLGEFSTLLIGGGEPTLRKDVVEIVQLFYKKNCVRDISMPSNCLNPDKVYDIAKRLLEGCPKAVINIGLSLDGIGEVHDRIRGVKGNFENVLEAEKELRELCKGNDRLKLRVITTVNNENYENLPELMKFVRKNMKVHSHYFEPLRGEPKDKNLKPITYKQLKLLNKKVLKNYTYYYKDKARMIYDLYNIRRNQRNAEQLLKNGTMTVRCTAGTTSAVIEANGDVRLCELLRIVGNLRKANYDFTKIWHGKEANELRKFIKEKKCACTHCVFLPKSPLTKFVEMIRCK